MAAFRIVRAMYAVPIKLARLDPGEIAMPDVPAPLVNADGLTCILFPVEQAELHCGSVL
jgi:hypothetical protein